MNLDVKKGCFIGVISALVYCVCSLRMYGYWTSRELFDTASKYNRKLIGAVIIIYTLYFIFSMVKPNDKLYATIDITFGILSIIMFHLSLTWLRVIGYVKQTEDFFGGFEIVSYILDFYYGVAAIVFFRVFITGCRLLYGKNERGVGMIVGAFVWIPVSFGLFMLMVAIGDFLR